MRRYQTIILWVLLIGALVLALLTYRSYRNGQSNTPVPAQNQEVDVTATKPLAPFDYQNAYTQAHIAANKEAVYQLQTEGTVTFLVVTDLHVNSLEDTRFDQLRDVVALTRSVKVDFVAVLGDLLRDPIDHESAMALLKKTHEILNLAACPVYYTHGDHDYNAADETYGNTPEEYASIITASDWANIFLTDSALVRDAKNPNGGYFYVDLPEKHHRAIFLNSYEIGSNEDGSPRINEDGSMGYWISGIKTETQVDWLIQKALNLDGKSGWTVSFFSHVIPYREDLSQEARPFHGYGKDNVPLRKLVQAFENGTSWSGAYNDAVPELSVDFKKQGKTPVIGWWGGHIHDDCYARIDDLNLFVSASTCAHARDSWSYDEHPVHLPPPRNDTNLAMSVNLFVSNPDRRQVNVVKFGSTSAQGMVTEFPY